MSSSRGGEGPPGVGRKRDPEEHQRPQALHARHTATLTSLFETLQQVVCPNSNKTPAKWKVLDHAKGFLREQEAQLSRLLTLTGIYLGNGDGPRNLEEVREEYRNLHAERSSYWSRRRCYRGPGPGGEEEGAEESSEEEEEDELTDKPVSSQSFVSFTSNILEFEGYMLFYRQTVEKLLHCGVLGPGQTSLHVVSDAISSLWDSMSPERRVAYQSLTPQQGPPSWAGLLGRPPVSDPRLQTSQADSQGSMASSASTYEEDLLQDACVVMEMDSSAMDSYEAEDSLQSGDLQDLREVVMGLVQTPTPQEGAQNLSVSDNDDEFRLRCSESFDSEDM